MTLKIHELHKKAIESATPNLVQMASDYISSGVVCHALLLLQKIDLIELLNKQKYLEIEDLNIDNSNQLIIKAAFKELEINGVFQRTDERYYLTEFGEELIKYLGLIFFIYDGYSNLFSNYFKQFPQPELKQKQLSHVNDKAIVIGSDLLADRFINPVIIAHLLELDLRSGSICDLGCGDGSRLQILSNLSKLNGIGIEKSEEAINLSNKVIKPNSNIKIFKDDISSLKGEYPEVTLLLQTMVMHDFTPTKYCVDIMNSYKKKFPNMEYFFYCDIVAPSEDIRSQLPGFDYIHAMLGIKTRTYKETLEVFKLSNFTVISESFVQNLPNTFLWVLKPKSLKKNTIKI